MASVFEVLGQSGRIPLDELVLRSSESADSIVKRLHELRDQGLVRLDGAIPSSGDGLDGSSDTVVELTRTGVRQVVEGR